MKIPRNKAAKGKRTKTRTQRRPKRASGAETVSTGAPQIWRAGDAIEEGEELDFDPSAYDAFVRFRNVWPCLSFDMIQNASETSDFPHCVSLIMGSQTTHSRDNALSLIKLKNIQRQKQKSNDEMETESSTSDSEDSELEEEDEKEASKEQLEYLHVQHLGGINRLRCMPQNPTLVAVCSERKCVQIYDLKHEWEQLEKGQFSANSVSKEPVFVHKQSDEGFALDWSKVRFGRLASGNCGKEMYVWEPQEGGCWNAWAFKNGHSASVEDIQWSPTEETVLASGSVDQTIKIWDSRDGNREQLSVQASKTDINVLSWNKDVTYMLASGDDQGVLKVWDLRTFSSGTPVAELSFHKKSITSVEWCPHESSMLATSSEDDQIGIWDLALERDPEEEAEFSNPTNAQVPSDIPPQLLFLHAGQAKIKELHWHPQIRGLVASTAEDGMHVFKASNVA